MANNIDEFVRDVLSHLSGLDERTKAIRDNIDQMRTEVRGKFDEMSKTHKNEIDEIKDTHKSLRKEIDDGYTKKVEFEPVKKLVYGVVSFLLLAVGGMIISLVNKNIH